LNNYFISFDENIFGLSIFVPKSRKMRHSLFIYIILLLFISGCKKDETGDPNYPTIIPRAADGEVDQIFKILSVTPLFECTSIDSFGFCIVSLKNKDCGKFDSIYVNYSKKEIIDMFHQSVFDYRDLLNLTDTAGIRVTSIKNIKGIEYDSFYKSYPDSIPKDWIVNSNLQKLGEYEIPGTEIKMLVSFDQVRSIGGKRYEKVYIPTTDIFSEESAKESLLDVELTYQNSKFKPTVNNYWYKSEKVIFPIIKSDRIELRVCWSLYPENWQVIIDTQTGEILNSRSF
jgi:hypothetical protein